ncbi:MAG: hypothetical protein PHD82_08900 [Candidatus Riflebacteria bacterium]|nr:hypothetical protein [Candidatus Riflebacteria bacterium]
MKRLRKPGILILLLIMATCAGAAEIKYAYKKGSTYSYRYTQSTSSKSKAFTVSTAESSPPVSYDFSVKSIDFQDGAFILDVGDKAATYRRYIRENGEIKGAPAEAGQGIPFFLTFPEGDWKVAEKRQVRKSLSLGNKDVMAIWSLLLKSVDNEKGLAEILFTANLSLPEDQLRQKGFSLKGRVVFNMLEGVIHQADWQTTYKFNFSNKAFAITRNLWVFEKQSSHTLAMTGIQE